MPVTRSAETLRKLISGATQLGFWDDVERFTQELKELEEQNG